MDELIQTKTLIFKIQNLNSKKKYENFKSKSKRYAFDISTRKKKFNSQIKPMAEVSTPPQEFFNSSVIRNFVSLTRSPSVKTFMAQMRH